MQEAAAAVHAADEVAVFAPMRVPVEGHEPQLAGGRGHVVLLVRNMPTPETVREALLLRPECSGLVEWWSAAWTSILAGLPSPPEPVSESDAGSHAARSAALPRPVGSAWNDAGSTRSVAAHAMRMRELHSAMAPGERDWRHHVVEDADSLRAVSETALPYRATFLLRAEILTFVGNGPDGFPILRRFDDLPWEARERVRCAVDAWDVDPMRYWTSKAFMAHAGRGFVECPDPASAAYALLAMARRGDARAFLKGVGTKTGTWTADLSGVRDASSAWASAAGSMWPSVWPDEGILVQDHLPTPEEQRFFVVRGRIVASVCSDRNLARSDSREGRILDERVAVLRDPETSSGLYDRGVTSHRIDRASAASLARKARSIVRDLAAEGMLDYVLDMGMSDRGPVAIELNTLVQAGPYCLDRRRHVRAAMRVDPLRIAPPVRDRTRDGENPMIPSPDEALDRAVSSLSDGAPLLASVPFMVRTDGRREDQGRFHVVAVGDGIACYATSLHEGRILVEPAGSPPSSRLKTPGQVLLACRPAWPADGTSGRMLFDDGATRLRAELLDRNGGRCLRLERTFADEPAGVLEIPVRSDALFAPDCLLDVRTGPGVGPAGSAKWSKVLSATFTISRTGTVATWTAVAADPDV